MKQKLRDTITGINTALIFILILWCISIHGWIGAFRRVSERQTETIADVVELVTNSTMDIEDVRPS